MPSNLRISGGPMFSTTVLEDGAGGTSNVINWDRPLWSYEILFVRESTDFMDILGFMLARRGRGYGFFYQDPFDYQAGAYGKIVQVGSDWRLVKEYPDISNYAPYQRLITRPISPTIAFTGNGTLDYTTGILTGRTSGAGTWTGEFDVPVCFETDTPVIERDAATGELASIRMKEVRSYSIAS